VSGSGLERLLGVARSLAVVASFVQASWNISTVSMGLQGMTSQLAWQRIRNRIIEMLEWIVDSECIPPELGMNELINSWADWVPGLPAADYFYQP
jgi:hypothetical protein